MGCAGSSEQSPKAERAKETTEEDAEVQSVEGDIEELAQKSGEEDQGEEISQNGYTEFELTALSKHNNYRTIHGVRPLMLNRELCATAQKWANHLAATDTFDHSTIESTYKGERTGENLHMNSSTDDKINGDCATDNWYDEIKFYDFKEPGFSTTCGHFTQVVWKGTTDLGIAYKTFKKDGWYSIVVVANYFPGGNMLGIFPENVPKLI